MSAAKTVLFLGGGAAIAYWLFRDQIQELLSQISPATATPSVDGGLPVPEGQITEQPVSPGAQVSASQVVATGGAAQAAAVAAGQAATAAGIAQAQARQDAALEAAGTTDLTAIAAYMRADIVRLSSGDPAIVDGQADANVWAYYFNEVTAGTAAYQVFSHPMPPSSISGQMTLGDWWAKAKLLVTPMGALAGMGRWRRGY